MKPTKTLIRALREAAQALRDGSVNYQWTDPEICNCGILARFALGIGKAELTRFVEEARR